MKKEDLRFKEWYGEGYYSGVEYCAVLPYDINDLDYLEKYCPEFNPDYEYSFGEIDGKHSNVTGSSEDNGSERRPEEEFSDMIIFYIRDVDLNVFDEHYYFYGSLSEEQKEVYKLLKKASDFVDMYDIKKTYRNKRTKEVYEQDDLEIIEVAVLKA